MKIQEVFKLYPKNEPNHKGTNYLTLVKIGDEICYSLTYYNDDCEFEPQFGKVVAFVQFDPIKILNKLTN